MSARSPVPEELVWLDAGTSSAGTSSAPSGASTSSAPSGASTSSAPSGASTSSAPSGAGTALPARFPSPFAVPPHPIARRAAELLVADLRGGRLGVDAALLDIPASREDPAGGGKMFGVLVVRASGTSDSPKGGLGYLRAFSGMLAGAWSLPGFVPPLFDIAARDAMWPAGQAVLRAHELELRALTSSAAYTGAKTHLASFDRELAKDLAYLQERHRERRAARKVARARLEPNIDGVCLDESPRATEAREAAMHALDQQSRGDTAERKRFDAEREAERASIVGRLEPLEARRAELERLRADESRGLMKQVHDHYTIVSARILRRPGSDGDRGLGSDDSGHGGLGSDDSAHDGRRSLRALFAPREPPGGAGDCAAPKLLGFAYAHGLTPIAIAEIWVGASPATGGRRDGAYYAACRGKCGPLLPFMLEGLDHDPIVDPGGAMSAGRPGLHNEGDGPLRGEVTVSAGRTGGESRNRPSPVVAQRDLDPPRVVFQDEHLLIVDKPVGLLSVPGRSGALRDSVQTRLRARFLEIHVVHRLDLDTSGLLIAAKSLATYKALQAMFARREIAKRYVAILDGDVLADEGTIEMALRVDLDDRPRQIVDDEHGKPATTKWRVLSRETTAAGGEHSRETTAAGNEHSRETTAPSGEHSRETIARVEKGARERVHTRVELVPLTGRTHQLRVHCAHRFGLDAPIIGDRLYGAPDSQHAPRLLLHAERLAFVHPVTGERVEVTSPAPF